MTIAASMPLSDLPDLDLPDLSDVEAAAVRLRGVAHRTPVLTSRTANERFGAQFFFKCENLQRAGSFKFRGAYNAIAALNDDARSRGVLAFSSGNHGQSLAFAGQLQGVKVTIVMPSDAPAMKIAATEGYGAEIILYDRFKESRDELVGSLVHSRGLTFVSPYDNRSVIAGQGTSALELIEDSGPLDMLFVCLGGGGLLSGCAIAAKAKSPGCIVIGVEPEAGNDAQQSFRSGNIITIPTPKSIADGALTPSLGQRNFAIIKALVSDILTVSDAQLIEAVKFFAERLKIIVEPTGCLGAAAAFASPLSKGKRVGVIISGGNVDLAAFARFVGT